MIETALAAALALASPAAAGAPESARPARPAIAAPLGMISFSLVDALAALRLPQLAGVFSFVSGQNAPFAFADLLARDKKSMKRYLDKLDGDLKAASGLTDWDHEVCASLINLYSSPEAATFGVPDSGRMKRINDCMLAPTVPLESVISRRKK